MTEEMTGAATGDEDARSALSPTAGGADAMSKLPTLQRNALCKIFDRPGFTPEEVASLGYRRLQQAEGIGQKGLAEITTWLKSYGFALPPLEVEGLPRQRDRARKSIELAVRLLRTHGYVVQPANEDTLPPRD
jgi:hypothetical protein